MPAGISTTVLPAGEELRVRRTANVHTGGTITDVTDELHPALARIAVDVAVALEIPVVGVDLMVPDVDRSGRGRHRGQRAARPRQPRTPPHR